MKYLANDNGALFVADDESEREKETMPGIIYRNPEPGISLDFLLIIISGMFNLIKAGLTPGNSHSRSVGGDTKKAVAAEDLTIRQSQSFLLKRIYNNIALE